MNDIKKSIKLWYAIRAYQREINKPDKKKVEVEEA